MKAGFTIALTVLVVAVYSPRASGVHDEVVRAPFVVEMSIEGSARFAIYSSTSFALAYASITDYCDECLPGQPTQHAHKWDSETDVDPPGNTSAHAVAQAWYLCDVEAKGEATAWAEASISAPDDQHIIMSTEAGFGAFPYCRGDSFHIALASNQLSYRVIETKHRTALGTGWTATITGSFPIVTDEPTFRRHGITVDFGDGSEPFVAFVMTAGEHALCGGGVLNELGDTCTVDESASGGLGEYQLDNFSFQFDDESMDVDESGRFNQHDVNTLEEDCLPGGCSDPDHVDRWDFDADGDVDEDDIAVMQTYVDLGLDSGVFGDLDGDGRACMADWHLLLGLFGRHLGDACYTPPADFDLDGDIDADDAQALSTLLEGAAICMGQGLPDDPSLGACCDDRCDVCADDVPQCDCSGRWISDADCASDPFDPPCGSAACCLPDFSCQELLQSDCANQGGDYFPDASCSDNTCSPHVCCVADLCSITSGFHCDEQDGYFLPSAVSCEYPSPPCECGACCTESGDCIDEVSRACMSKPDCDSWPGEYIGGASCDDDPCAGPDECSIAGTCCVDGHCIDTNNCECAGLQGQFVEGACCLLHPFGEPEACCVDYGSCTEVGPDCCVSSGGHPQGTGTDCATVECILVPAVSEWGLAAMALLVLAAGTVVLTRRRRAVTAR